MMESVSFVDEASGDMRAEYCKFRGQILRKTEKFLLVLQGTDLSDETTKTKKENRRKENNSNNNNNTTNLAHNQINNSGFRGTPKYMAFVKASSERLECNSTKDVEDAKDRFFVLHSLDSENEDAAKKFLEKSLHTGTSIQNNIDNTEKSSKSSGPALVCFPCSLTFTFGPSFAGHVINHHGLDLSDLEVQILELDNTNAVLQKTDDQCEVLYLEPLEKIPDSLKKTFHLEKAQSINERLKVNELIKSKADSTTLQSGLPGTLNISNQNRAREKEKQRNDCSETNSIANREVNEVLNEDFSTTGNLHINSKSVAALFKNTSASETKVLEHSRGNTNKNTNLKTKSKSEHVGEKVLDLSVINSKALKSSRSTSSSTVAKQRMLEREAMSFAVASPLDAHAQSPTAHPVLMNNVIHNHDSKSKGVEFAAFLSQKKAENDQHPDDDYFSTSQTFGSSSSPLSSKKEPNPSSTPENDSSILNTSLITNQQDGDSIENTAASLDPLFPMTLFQSRNSCKTLKCPKCNWHYKYRQTLEAHMKEKHFEETSDCIYCNAGQPHPRLSRGETYSCGYKPFKCNVCNYSTTTKGNLSIHMQSDKHLYNARSLQQRQQERIRQGGTTASQPNESTSSQNENVQQNAKGSSSPSSVKITEYNGLSMEKQLHSRRRRSSNKTSSSVDSGIFSSASKVDSPTSIGTRRESTSSSGGKWRCDVCCYETGIARNLRIHMTSEKHAQNLALSEKGLLKHLRQDNDANRSRPEPNQSAEISQLSAPSLADYYTAFKSLQQPTGSDTSGKSLSEADDFRQAHAQYLQHQLFLAQQQQILLAQQYQQIMMAAAASSLQQRLSQSSDESSNAVLAQTKQQELMLQNQIWKQLFPQSNLETASLAQDLKPLTTSMTGECFTVFSCGLCGIYGTDEISALENHIRKQRLSEGLMDPINSEWVVKDRSRDRENYYCKLCSYSTTLKTNFNLHCKTEKHSCKLNLISHVREGGAATAWMIPHIINGNLAQRVSCNACQFVTHSFEKLKLHCATDQHQGVFNVCQYLQSLMKNQISLQKEEKNESKHYQFRCRPCDNFSTKHIVEMVKHMQTAEHQLELQKQKNSSMGTLEDVVAIEEADNSPTKKTEEQGSNIQCDCCNYSCDDQARMQLHMMTQHNDHPPTPCPLCKELLKSPLQLRLHLVKAHQLQLSSIHDGSDDSAIRMKPNKTEMKQTLEENKSSDAVHDVIDDVKNMEDLPMDSELQQSGSLVIDEDADLNVKQNPAELKDGKLEENQSSDVGKMISGSNSSSKSRFINSSSLIMQVLKGDGLPHSSAAQTLSDKISSSAAGKGLMASTNREKNSVLRNSVLTDSLTSSCPNLLDAVNDSSQEHSRSRKVKRVRMRSYPVDEFSGGKSFCHLLCKYGLEQAMHYVENRSFGNKKRAKSFRLEKMEDKWSSSFSEPDAAEKEELISVLDKKFKKSISCHTENEKSEEDSVSCSQCGKQFSDLWILKTHQEFSHGICVSTSNIRNVASAYSNQIMEKTEDTLEKKRELNSLEISKINVAQSPANEESLAKDEDSLLAQQQQMQNQAVLQALLKMQSIKQTDSLENDVNRNNPLENLLPGSVLRDTAGLSSNLASQMGLYSALLQTQALGIHPYQMLSNVAALQQMQHLASPSLLGIADDISARSGSSFPGSLPSSISLSSLESQYRASGIDSLQKQDPSTASENSSLLGHIQNQSSVEIPAKRPRTRITDEQLKILRANFDINNSPSEDQIEEMALRTGLPPKVIKHWFRNTLFKERQRSKDSPYNFNIPPVMSLEDVQKPASEKQEELMKASCGLPQDDSSNTERKILEENLDSEKSLAAKIDDENSCSSNIPTEHSIIKNADSSNDKSSFDSKLKQNKLTNSSASEITQGFASGLFSNALSLAPSLSPKDRVANKTEKGDSNRETQSMLALANLNFPKQLFTSQMGWQSGSNYDNDSNNMYDNSTGSEAGMFSSISSNLCRRTPRTRFTDFQLQVLQEFFDRNAYPKDDDLDKLSQTLNLSTRVIVVWFQNARQKARKLYEQQQHHIQQRSQSPPGLDPMQSLKLEERLLTEVSSKGLENIARKSLNEANKHLSDKSSLSFNGAIRKDAGAVTTENDISKASMETEQKAGKSSQSSICQICDKTFSTAEKLLAHQREHINANFASIFEHYGVNYMKGLVDKQILEEKLDSKTCLQKDEGVIKANTAGQLAFGSHPSVLGNLPISKSPTQEDSFAALSKFFASEKQSSMAGTLAQSGAPTLVGAAKRKASTSPSLTHHPTSSAKTSFSANSGSFQNKMSPFAEDKDTGGAGMQKDPKRLRTTITPEQLEYLYQQYLFDSSPSRKVIEQISEIVGLKKRVVQVWFQNTRARERKGQFRSSIARCVSGQMAQSKLCQLCRMVFRSKEELDHHLRTKHVSQSAETSLYSSDEPSEKKLRLSQSEVNDVAATKDLPAFQTVKSLLPTESVQSNNSNYNFMINSTPSVTAASIRSVKTESPTISSFQTSVLKDEKPPLPPSSHPLEYSKLFGKIKTDLSSGDLQSKLSALYTTSSLKEPQLGASTSLSETQAYGNASQPIANVNAIRAESESSTVDENDRKVSHKGEDGRETSKPRDIIQPMTSQSGFPSMVANNAAIDGGSTPTKRHRTQMSSVQVRALKHCYKAFKTPTLAECELIGNEIGLLKRVVRVWFQNARAKEKKQKLRQNHGQTLDHGDLMDKSEGATQCDICQSSFQFTSTQLARDHYFSREHLQKLMKTVESKKKQDSTSGFSTSHSSPCSSYDSSENIYQSDNFGSDSFSEVPSPVMKHHVENPSPSHNEEGSPTMLTMFQQNKSENQNEDRHIGSHRNASESDTMTDADEVNSNYSQLFATNPNLFQHYQKAVQQLLTQQGQKDQENASQALFQQALQKSLYQILKLPQTSPTESQ